MKYIRYLVFFFLSCTAYATQNLVIGTIPNAPPFEFLNEVNNLSGFDPDIMNALCNIMGRKCTFKLYSFHKLFAALDDGQIDLAIAAIMITPEREKRFLFSLPYKFTIHQYVTLADSKLTAVAQLKGKIIGIYKSSPEEELISKQFKGKVKVKSYYHVNQMIDALKRKKVDAIMLEYHRAVYWLSNTPNFKLIGGTFTTGEGYGIAARKGRKQLIQDINNAITHIENDGTYLKIYQLYF